MTMSTEQDFHKSRRAFIIIMHHTTLPHNPGLMVAPKNTDISHEQMLNGVNFYGRELQDVLMKSPRGYCMDGELCVYQGFSGPTWELTESNYKIVQQYMPDLCALFNLNKDSNLYLGVRVGRVGSVWERINQTTIGQFMRMR